MNSQTSKKSEVIRDFFFRHFRGASIVLLLIILAFKGSKILFFIISQCPSPIGERAALFVEGTRMTVHLTVLSGIFSLVLGTLAGVMRLNRKWYIKMWSDIYLWVFRGTPLLVQILFSFYALPLFFPYLEINEFKAAVIALSLNCGAYNADVIRAGLSSVSRHQRDASFSLGLNRMQGFFYIIFPQAIRLVTPPLLNNLVALLKDSAMAQVIGLLELSLSANRISTETFLPLPSLLTAAMIYLFLSTLILGFEYIILQKEKKIRGHRN